MPQQEKDISSIFSSDSLSIFHWIKILNYFEQHKQHLNVEDLKKIVDKCEEHRLYLNKDIANPITQVDTSPNVYEYLEKMQDNKNTHGT